jgi:hypothetical protein
VQLTRDLLIITSPYLLFPATVQDNKSCEALLISPLASGLRWPPGKAPCASGRRLSHSMARPAWRTRRKGHKSLIRLRVGKGEASGDVGGQGKGNGARCPVASDPDAQEPMHGPRRTWNLHCHGAVVNMHCENERLVCVPPPGQGIMEYAPICVANAEAQVSENTAEGPIPLLRCLTSTRGPVVQRLV